MFRNDSLLPPRRVILGLEKACFSYEKQWLFLTRGSYGQRDPRPINANALALARAKHLLPRMTPAEGAL